MINSNVKYITLNDSRVIANSMLDVGGVSVEMSIFDFSKFSNEQRKVIFGWSSGKDQARYNPCFRSEFLSSQVVAVHVPIDGESITIKMEEKLIVLDGGTVCAGDYMLEVSVFLDKPLETLGEVPDHIKPLLQYSQIVNVMASFYEIDDVYNKVSGNSAVYDSAGQLGFFLTDINKMDDFIRSGSSVDVVDLQKAFCESELANELFEAGLLILVWGMTPWQYYVCGLASLNDMGSIPSVASPQLSGKYRIRSDIKELSVIPGEELLNWPACRIKEWPKVQLLGVGESVAVNVHIRSFSAITGALGPRLVVVSAHREDVEPVIEPLLMVDIESFDPVPGF